jgi:hypothetical protein
MITTSKGRIFKWNWFCALIYGREAVEAGALECVEEFISCFPLNLDLAEESAAVKINPLWNNTQIPANLVP